MTHINQDITKWRLEAQGFVRDIVSSFRVLVNGATWLNPAEQEKIQSKIDDLMLYTGVPKWVDDDKAIQQNSPIYHENISDIEMEMGWQKIRFDNLMKSIVDGEYDLMPWLDLDEIFPDFGFGSGYKQLSNSLTGFKPQLRVNFGKKTAYFKNHVHARLPAKTMVS